MRRHTIRLIQEFNPRPFGRFREHGGNRSAEAFREEYLIPALEAHEDVVVDLSGYDYYGSSFLEETFGGLVRKGRFPQEELVRRLKVLHKELPSIGAEATGYLAGKQA